MILITTPVANFEKRRVSAALSLPNQLAYAQRYALRHPDWNINVYDAQGNRVYLAGDESLVPAVWSHTPFPFGMHPEIIQGHFEDRATGVLGDHDNIPSFLKCAPDGPWIYKDNRYYCEGLRMAWMMYVDLAIEHFNTKV